MRYKNPFAIPLLAVLGTATPAFANPHPAPFGPIFLPSVLLLFIAHETLLHISGGNRVLKAIQGRDTTSDRPFVLVILVAVSLLISVLVYLALAIWSLVFAARMLVWGIVAAVRRERPAKLESVRPFRMILCSGLLLLSVLATGYLFTISMRPYRMWRGTMAKAVSEIRNADLALTKLLSDAQCAKLHQLFANPAELDRSTLAETIKYQTTLCYELLLKGKDAKLDLKPEMRQKLGASYMDIGRDPWGNAYQFYFGPLKCRVNEVPFRGYRGEKYIYDRAAFEELEKRLRNNPEPDADIPPAPGYPAPGDLAVYIFSYGQNKKPEQLPWNGNGGDDINNWDTESGWGEFY